MTLPDESTGAPVVVLGVSRSGTTLLKEMLDRSSQLAIPSESYFIPQLYDRHGERPQREAILADLGRLDRIREWGVTAEQLAVRLPAEPSFSQAIQAVYHLYAERQGATRFGDKTPAYMQRLDLLERVFPGARYVHILRDGRDAALSFLAMRRKPRFNWSRPRRIAGFACAWRLEIEGARRFAAGVPGRYLELRYEDLVAEPEERLRELCAFLRLPFEPQLLEVNRQLDPARLLDHPRLAEPPRQGLRNWRTQLAAGQAELFEAIAGELLWQLGYERVFPHPSASTRRRAICELALARGRLASWSVAVRLTRRSPLWRLRQAYLRRSSVE